MAETTHRTKGKKARLGLALASLALLPWGAAAFVLGTGTQAAQASPQEKYQDHDVFLHVEQNGESFFVRIDMFVAANGFGAIDQSGLEAAKAEIISRFPGAVELEESAVAAQYVTSGFKWTSNSTSWGYNGTGAPSTVAGSALSAVSSSASTWGSGSNFHFSGGGASGAGTGACGGGTDGQNTVGWANQTGSVLAVTCSWYNGGSPFGAASEFDMQIDPEWTWSTGGAVNIDLQSVVTHEFGHALGLNHSGDGSAVMYPSYSAGSTKRSLAPDDLAGLVAIYGAVGGGATNTPTSTPTTPAGTAINTPTATPTGTPTPVPQQPHLLLLEFRRQPHPPLLEFRRQPRLPLPLPEFRRRLHLRRPECRRRPHLPLPECRQRRRPRLPGFRQQPRQRLADRQRRQHRPGQRRQPPQRGRRAQRRNRGRLPPLRPLCRSSPART